MGDSEDDFYVLPHKAIPCYFQGFNSPIHIQTFVTARSSMTCREIAKSQKMMQDSTIIDLSKLVQHSRA